jgi:transketolase
MLSEGTDVTIVATDTYGKRLAAEALEAKGISAEVINIHTIKPLDEEAILKSLAKQNVSLLLKSTILGGLEHFKSIGIKQPTPQEFAVNDSFGESGTPAN